MTANNPQGKAEARGPLSFFDALTIVREHRDYIFAVHQQGDADAGRLIAALDRVMQHAVDRNSIAEGR